MTRRWVVLVTLAMAIASCRRTPAAAAGATVTPTIRLYVVSTAAGALEPCGCTKDQLGGVNHATAFVQAQKKDAPHSLVVGAGPMLFLDPASEPGHATQDLWKAEALAASLGDMGLVAWAPGENDWAAGAPELERLAKLARADLLAGNLSGATAGAKATRVIEINGYRVGLAGVSDPSGPLGLPAGVTVSDPKAALVAALADLRKQNAQVLVALVAVERGRALRLAELVPGFQAFVVGKPYDKGDGNDPTIPPELVGDTLVIQAPNHIQGVAVLDLFVRGSFDFKDGTGISAIEQRQSLEQRILDIERRVGDGGAKGASAADIAARKKDLGHLRQDLAALPAEEPPVEGSFFRYRSEAIHDTLGTAPGVQRRIDDYYARVNDHNRDAFKDRLPPPVPKGEASYVGIDTCAGCHDEEYKFWQHTPHAGAYAALSKQHKEFNLDCVSCHVTGYEKPGGSTVTHVAGLENVQCEVCHGPGSLHEDDPTKLGTIIKSPPKSLCAPACHHPPHVHDDWSVDAAWKVIVGKGHGMK